LHCTSDILNIEKKEGEIEITLFGDRDLVGEIVLEGSEVERIREVQMNGKKVESMRDENRIVIYYNHCYREFGNLNISY
jgi:hypothetical protein